MTVETDPESPRREAAAWFARLKQRRVASEDVKAFSAWRRSPANAEAFARIEAMWEAAEVLGHDPDMASLTLAAAGRGVSHKRSSAQRFWKPAVAAVMGVVVLGASSVWFLSRPLTYATDVGERREIQLTDGSTVTLDTASRIAVRMRGRERGVELLSGQALFTVRRDVDRPFVVRAGEMQVTALGTRFDVRRLPGDVRVVLVEGSVRVDAGKDRDRLSWTLKPNQQIAPSAATPAVVAIDAERATSWTRGRLIFDKTPISAAVAEVNRYSDAKVELEAASIADIAVSGAFDAGEIEGFVSALTELYPVSARRSDDGGIVIRDAPRK